MSPVLFLLAFLLLWQVAIWEEWVSTLVVPPPADVAKSFVELLSEGNIWPDIRVTTLEAVGGFVVGSLCGVLLAVLAGVSLTLRNMVYPWALTLQVTPLLAIAPIVVAAFGFGYGPKVIIAALIAFFPVFINTLTGMLAVAPEADELFRSIGATKRQILLRLQLPTALPVIFAGLKIAISIALAGAVVAEFVSASRGLGLLVQRFSYQLNMDDAYAIVLILILLGLALYAVVSLADRWFVYWRHDSRLIAISRRRARQVEKRLGYSVGASRPANPARREVDPGIPVADATVDANSDKGLERQLDRRERM